MLMEIAWRGHTVLHDLKLNFCKPDGTPYRTVIIAGENGTGKTSILSSINDLMKGRATPTIEYVKYEREGTIFTASPDTSNHTMGFYTLISPGSDVPIQCNVDINHHNPTIDNDPTQLRFYGCLYLTARSGFKTSPIKSTTTKHLDDEKDGEDEDYDYTGIKQLLVDLDEQDAKAYRKAVNNVVAEYGLVDKKFTEDVISLSRMSRFTGAFNDFFQPYMKYSDVDSSSSTEKVIRFIKNGELINIDQLSTGEKQIVFRGAYCLKNIKALYNGLILIDEPELSMHPKWQVKILQYYRDIFTEDSVQKAQMIITTHSDHIISEALSCRDEVKVIILKSENGTIVAHDVEESVLPRIQSSEVNYIAFGLATLDYFLALYCRVQELAHAHGKKDSIDGCDEFIKEQDGFDDTLLMADDFNKHHFDTLPTYIRNGICHPNSKRVFDEKDVERCIVFLRSICTLYRDESEVVA